METHLQSKFQHVHQKIIVVLFIGKHVKQLHVNLLHLKQNM